MPRKRSALIAGTVILDSAGLSLWCAGDKRVTALLREAQESNFAVVVSALTPIEASDVRTADDRLRWHLSRLTVEPVSEEIARQAIDLLREAGLHGHEYAIDAVVAATALRSAGPVVILTSDADDMGKLCGKRVRVVPV